MEYDDQVNLNKAALQTKYVDLKPIVEEHGGLILNNIYCNINPKQAADEILDNSREEDFDVNKLTETKL